MAYAEKTTVTVKKSREQIEDLLYKHGAEGFGYAYEDDRAMVMFSMERQRIRVSLNLPPYKDFALTMHRQKRSVLHQKNAHDQACRQRWRALYLIIRAKLEAIESGVSTVESEFMADIMLPSGETVGEWVKPQLGIVYDRGGMPALLPGNTQ